MAIVVVCPSCRKRYQVSDKFAGMSGACPNCKKPIRVPTKAEEVKIFEPGESPEDIRRGRGKIKPLPRLDARWNATTATIVGASVAVAFISAWVGGRTGALAESFLVKAIGLLLVSPPLVVAGYTFLREGEDLAPFRGRDLWLRAAICSLVYAIMWWVYGYVASQLVTEDLALWNWFLIAPPFFLAGGFAALSCFDLDYASGFFHYSFYVIVTTLLRASAGLGWPWQPPG